MYRAPPNDVITGSHVIKWICSAAKLPILSHLQRMVDSQMLGNFLHHVSCFNAANYYKRDVDEWMALIAKIDPSADLSLYLSG